MSARYLKWYFLDIFSTNEMLTIDIYRIYLEQIKIYSAHLYHMPFDINSIYHRCFMLVGKWDNVCKKMTKFDCGDLGKSKNSRDKVGWMMHTWELWSFPVSPSFSQRATSKNCLFVILFQSSNYLISRFSFLWNQMILLLTQQKVLGNC